jgi:hypothetical protein
MLLTVRRVRKSLVVWQIDMVRQDQHYALDPFSIL